MLTILMSVVNLCLLIPVQLVVYLVSNYYLCGRRL